MTKEIYNKFYKKHGAGVHSDAVRFREIAKLCEGRVLDIACGTGDLADYVKGEYLGVDISDVAVKLARESRRKDAEFQDIDFLKPFKADIGKFDTIVLAEFLEHIDEDKVLFENIKKLSHSRTKLIISVPNGDRIPDANHLRTLEVPDLRREFSEFGKVSFHNWIGFNNRILMSVQMGETVGNDLTLSMIVWNEFKGLETAILSCIDFVDKIVISVDLKSDDGTMEIATRYADVVKRHKWENNFAKARNWVDEGIETKWILSLDGHEFIKSYKNLEEKLKSDADGLMLTMEMESGDTFVTPRIYRSGNVWENAIHNSLKLEKLEKFTDFVITHDRAGGQSEKSTAERLEQVKDTMEVELKKELKKEGSGVRALFYLARYYRQFYKWKKAIKYYKKYLKKSPHKAEKWLCAYEAGVISNSMGKHLLALKFFNQANEIIPNRWEIKKHIGLTYLSFKQYEKALVFLVESLEINTGEFTFNPEKRDDGETWDKIGFCFFQLKQWFEAKEAWTQGIKIGTDKIQIEMNKKRITLLEKYHKV